MINNFQYFDIDITINDKRDVRGLILHNKIKIVLISDVDINRSICSVGVGAGYLQDSFEGTAHFLEHLLFMGSEKYPKQNDYTSYIQTCGGIYNAFTADNMTVYYLELDTSFFKKGVEMLSWFFRKPILDMNHINSERDIINSEHEKNILDDRWITDDLFKYFVKEKTKYCKFGTGNNESLKDITKEDIMDFYKKFYTTDNMYVCIIDNKPIDTMIKEYIPFFNDIEDNFYNKENNDRFNKEIVNFNGNNLIIFNSISEYNFLNIYNIFKCDNENQIDYQLLNLINYLIGSEYDLSLSYYLKENDIIKNMKSSIDYFYDHEANINIKLILTESSFDSVNKIIVSFNNLLNELYNLTEENFKKIYENFQKINLLKCLYSNNDKSVDTAIDVIDNLIKSEPRYAILRKGIVPNYDSNVFKRFIEIIDSIKIKIITNVNFKKNIIFQTSKWYNTKYVITEHDFLEKNFDKNNDFKFNLLNCIGIKDFVIKTDIFNKKINKKEIPQLVYKNDIQKRIVYYLEKNKYNQPIASVSLLRKNVLLKDKEHRIIMLIYINLCKILLNYYLEVMSDYKMYFDIAQNEDNLIYNFSGLSYLINKFIFDINKVINPETFLLNPVLEKKFYKFIRDFKEYILNSKYECPYIRCIETQKIILNNSMFPDETINFIKKLTFDDFKNKLKECLKYQYETFIIVGIDNDNKELSNKKYIVNENINYIIEALCLDHNLYLLKNNIKTNNLFEKLNYVFKKNNINQKEKNNCLMLNYIVDEIDIEYDNNFINKSIIDKIIKNKIIYQLVSEIINEPLFDQVRTIDKIGYIVKCDFVYKNLDNKSVMIVFFLIQSIYGIDKITKSIKKFNSYIKNDIKKNKSTYIEKFENLKKSKILSLEKPFLDLEEEIGTYISSFSDKYGIFNINDLLLEICKNIQFKDIIDGLNKVTNSSITHKIVLDTKILNDKSKSSNK